MSSPVPAIIVSTEGLVTPAIEPESGAAAAVAESASPASAVAAASVVRTFIPPPSEFADVSTCNSCAYCLKVKPDWLIGQRPGGRRRRSDSFIDLRHGTQACN